MHPANTPCFATVTERLCYPAGRCALANSTPAACFAGRHPWKACAAPFSLPTCHPSMNGELLCKVQTVGFPALRSNGIPTAVALCPAGVNAQQRQTSATPGFVQVLAVPRSESDVQDPGARHGPTPAGQVCYRAGDQTAELP